MTKMGAKRIHLVRGRGGNLKYRALRLETGNFSWGSEGVLRERDRELENLGVHARVARAGSCSGAACRLHIRCPTIWHCSHISVAGILCFLAVCGIAQPAAGVARRSHLLSLARCAHR